MSREPARLTVAPALGARRDDSGPRFISPQLATLVEEAPRGDDWLHELKLDGYRVIVVVDGADTALWSRNHKSWTGRLPSLTGDIRALGRRAVIDGEAVLFDQSGRASYEQLVNGVHHGREGEVVLQAFDLLWLDGWDLTDVPLEERKRTLCSVLADGRSSRMRYLDHIAGEGERVFRAACESGAEGIVSKRRGARYHSRRDGSWQKVKCSARQELIVVGWTPPTHERHHLGSLVLGFYDDGRLRYAGRVGTGFSHDDRRQLRTRLERLERQTSPLAEQPKVPGLKDARWTTPRLVAEVKFTEWTKAGHVRHPSFLGLREDKAPEEVVRESARS